MSFEQFEREVTSERIATRSRPPSAGWGMGWHPALGYEMNDGKIAIAKRKM